MMLKLLYNCHVVGHKTRKIVRSLLHIYISERQRHKEDLEFLRFCGESEEQSENIIDTLLVLSAINTPLGVHVG